MRPVGAVHALQEPKPTTATGEMASFIRLATVAEVVDIEHLFVVSGLWIATV